VTLVYHELRSPLGLVATAARSAADDCPDDDLRRRCETIVRAAERMLRVADNVLAIEKRRQAEASDAYHPVEVLRGLTEDLRRLGAPVCLVADPATEELTTSGPRGRFEALVQSLVGNACDHGEQVDVVFVEAAAREGALEVTISNRFAQVTRHRGLGLGRYIADRLATELGATLHYSTTRDRFLATIIIPLQSSSS
jgi:signal transduction histidine kinase